MVRKGRFVTVTNVCSDVIWQVMFYPVGALWGSKKADLLSAGSTVFNESILGSWRSGRVSSDLWEAQFGDSWRVFVSW